MCKPYVRFIYRICSPSHCRNASFGIDANTDVLLSFIAFEDVIVLNLFECVLMIMCLIAVASGGKFYLGSFKSVHQKGLSLFSDSFCSTPIGGDK